MHVEAISYELVDPDPDQPRRTMDEDGLKELTASINEHGQLQAGIVYQNEDRFILVDGHRRHAALGHLKAETFHAVVLEHPPDPQTLLVTQLAVNSQREDLKPIEQARAYERLMKAQSWSHAELAEAMHISKAKVTQTLSYLALPESVQSQLNAGQLSGSTAYAISRAGDAATQQSLADKAVNGDLTRDEVQRIVSRKGRRRQRSTFRLGGNEISLQTEDTSNLTECVEVLQQLLRECRKAIKQGLDVGTFERVLTDRERATK